MPRTKYMYVIHLIIAVLRVALKCIYYGAYSPSKITANVVLLDDFQNDEWQQINILFSEKSNPGTKLLKFDAYRKFNIINLLDLIKNIKRIKSNYRKFLKQRQKFEYNKINLGTPIIESFLRSGNAQFQANIKSAYYYVIAMLYFERFSKIVRDERVEDILLSHENYVYYAIAAEIIIRERGQIHFINKNNYVKADRMFSQFKIFKDYRSVYDKLSLKDAIEYRKMAKQRLNLRFSGELKIDMDYQELSAYHQERQSPIITNKTKLNILLALHCFIDNPHAYERLDYTDFYVWVEDILQELSLRTDCSVYMKVHRDAPQETKNTARLLGDKYTIASVISEQTSLHQLIEEGLDVAITGYGSIAHELPYLGVPVVSCFYNPHVSFNFTYHKREGQNFHDALISSIKSYDQNKSQKEIEEFYIVHNLLRANGLFHDKTELEKTVIMDNVIERSSSSHSYDSRLDNEYFIRNT